MAKGDRTSLGDRIKEYEAVSKSTLVRRMPVFIRLDGKAFHTFCRHFQKPFDPIMAGAMQDTMLYLCRNIQNCVLGYTQSDEITLVLVDYKNVNTDAWFGNEVQKMASISASMATYAFSEAHERLSNRAWADYCNGKDDIQEKVLVEHIRQVQTGLPLFDARVFNVPENDAVSAVYWRQLDCMRNSKTALALSVFSHKELDGKSGEDKVTMVKEKTGILWNNLPVWQQRGCCAVKGENGWELDLNIPVFKGEGRDYITKLIRVE